MHGQVWGATIAPAAATMRASPWHGSLTPAARLHARENRQESSEKPQKGRQGTEETCNHHKASKQTALALCFLPDDFAYTARDSN
jgi:hypothetical protein